MPSGAKPLSDGGRQPDNRRLRTSQTYCGADFETAIGRTDGPAGGGVRAGGRSVPERRKNIAEIPDKKSGRPRLFGLPQAGVLLEKWELLLPKKFGMCDPCLREYFPGSRRCCEAAPDSAERIRIS